jgi:hypothetical protein
MTIYAARDRRIAILKEEIDSIHVANFAYWHRKDDREPSREARADYQQRRERLEAIRHELLDMASKSRRSLQSA